MVLRLFDNGLVPGLRQAPQGFLSIDWAHPLANGLVGYYLPGVTLWDVARQNPGPLILGSSPTGVPFSLSPEGPASDMTNANGFESTASYIPNIGSATAMSVYCRGYRVGNPTASGNIIGGITHAEPNTSPFGFIWIAYSNATTGISVQLNRGALFSYSFTNTMVNNAVFSLGCTAVSSGNVVTYFNGAVDSTQATGGVISASNGGAVVGGGLNGFVSLVAMWNRTLTADEMMRMHLAPYEMLVPAEYELPVARLIVPARSYPPFQIKSVAA